MKVWIVFVRVRWNSTNIVRYIDSQWAENKSARARADELEAGWRTFGCYSSGAGFNGAYAEITEATVVDVKITDPKPEGQ